MDIGHGPHILHPRNYHHEHHHHGHTETSAPPDSAPLYKTEHENHHNGISRHDHSSHSMMSFHDGVNETILFKFWQSQSTLTLVISCIVIFLVAVMYEALKFYREWLFRKWKRRLEGGFENHQLYQNQQPHPLEYSQHTTQAFVFRPATPSIPPPVPKKTIRTSTPTRVNLTSVLPIAAVPAQVPPSDDRIATTSSFPRLRIWFCKIHIFQTFLHMLQVFISFLLMLVFMTYNVWLCVAVILGAGVGYFIFFAKNSIVLEHCN